MIGYAICGSHCTHRAAISILRQIVETGEDVVPILSEASAKTDTRFGKAAELVSEVEKICKRSAVTKISESELFGAHTPLDYLVISPCTGNTLAKIALGMSDGAVTMAAKAHLRCDRPLLIALSTNDAMSQNLSNIATMLARKSVYFAPLYQDAPEAKPHSLVSRPDTVFEAYLAMKSGKQLRPLFR